jgi:hypothetical protein
LKNSKNKSSSTKFNDPRSNYFNNYKISIEDYESIRYPDMDTKRAVIEKMLADKINDLYRIIDGIDQKSL